MANHNNYTCFWTTVGSSADCAAWVQAFGSILGLGVAIVLPLCLWVAERRHAKANARALYRMVRSSVKLRVDQSLGCIAATLTSIEAFTPGFNGINLTHFRQMFDSLVLPEDVQLSALADVDPDLAVLVAEGRDKLVQGKNSLHLLEKRNLPPVEVHRLLTGVSEMLRGAQSSLLKAMERMDNGVK